MYVPIFLIKIVWNTFGINKYEINSRLNTIFNLEMNEDMIQKRKLISRERTDLEAES